MKNFWDKIKNKLKQTWGIIKTFFSNWKNWVITISVLLTVVFFCLWKTADWCRVAAIGCLAFSLLFLSLYATSFYLAFVRILNQEKRRILEDLAVQFDKEEYLQLNTPFNAEDEKFLQKRTKNYRNIMIGLWLFFVIIVYLFISMLTA